MELRPGARRTSTRPLARTASVLVLIAAAVMSWQLITGGKAHQPRLITPASAVVGSPLIDRNAEREPMGSTRTGGPGGQIGDAPSTP